MLKKAVAIATLSAFLIFEWSCTIYKTEKKLPEEAVKTQVAGAQITRLVLKSGQEIFFDGPQFGRIVGDFIADPDRGLRPVKVEIPNADVQAISSERGGTMKTVATKSGQLYRASSLVVEGEKTIITGFAFDRFYPLSEVELVHVRRIDGTMTFFASVGAAVLIASVAVGAMTLIWLATKESCPFVYSFDGTTYVFDAEPYGGATSEGVKRTEWCGLQYLKDVQGEYKLRITNEVAETQYTDELKLFVVEHPRGVRAVADEAGNIHTLAGPQPPLRATDGRGRDILPRVARNDGLYWLTRTEEKDPDRTADLRDELLFEFPKPAGARTAKLLFNGCNTLWASQMLKRILELYGADVAKSYEALRSPGPAQKWRAAFNEREELYRLQLRVETPAGWVTKGSIVGGGPFVSEDRVYVLDVADVPGAILRIKLTPPAEFWMINQLAVDYSPDRPVEVRELAAARAVDNQGRDIRPELAATDGRYFIMPETGDWAELAFRAPARRAGMERTVIMKASGYYDIRLQAQGRPRLDIFYRFVTEPGFVVQYSFREYLKWEAETLAQLRK